MKAVVELAIESISKCVLPEGGFPGLCGSRYRPDATAWAIIALDAAAFLEDVIDKARSRLASGQMKDGTVSISPDYPQAFWATPLAILAWYGSDTYREAQTRAIQFLRDTSGKHWKKRNNSPFGHDTSLRGWPWIGETHSWVEPTSLVLLALELTGHGDHKRAKEGRRMLLDRQLRGGGWNYGNTVVFGQELRPMPESTGMALSALNGRVSRKDVEKSILYLKSQIRLLSTPLALGWSILGLASWGERPEKAEDSVSRCMEKQQIYGGYQISWISVLLVSLLAEKGLLNLIAEG
jgi:hypothetical protein